MIRQKIPIKTLVLLLLVIGLLLGPTTALAQDESPAVDLSDSTIDVEAGEGTTVTAEYQFTVDSAGSSDSSLTSISGTIWQVSERDIGEITATVDGETVEPDVSEASEHLDVSVPVEDVSSGDTVTVTLEYQISEPDGELKTPLWVPEFSTPGEANVIDMTVTLPEETTLSSDSFPSADTVDGNTVEYNLLHVPGFVKMSYGESGPGMITSDTLYSLVGVVLIVGFVVGGLAIDRKTA